ncbi:MAG: hypothetical protein CVU05_13090 [Bacteroidetes bacterium HGW-Bacteroidetes-21]|jgi:hypothetical protein|nr:MAG: hypothetical protein CVU05_13090 [Bacteroidetes bacterium HGW-Bacteroidetes-21]
MNFDWIEKQEEQINESTYSENKVVSKNSIKKKSVAFSTFNEALHNLVVSENVPKEIKHITNIHTGYLLRNDGGREYVGMAERSEIAAFLWIFRFSKKQYLTRKIRFYADDDSVDIRISLHEKWKSDPNEDSFKKRKFRFYVKSADLSIEFANDCLNYLFFKKSNHELIKSIPHFQREDDGILIS